MTIKKHLSIKAIKNKKLYPKRYNMKRQSLQEFVKQKRKEAGLTQIELSEKSGVGLRFIRELEQGKQTLRMDKVNNVLMLFGQELGPTDMDRAKLLREEE